MDEFTRTRAQIYLAAWLIFIAGLAVVAIRQGNQRGIVTNPLTQLDCLLALVAMADMYGLALVLLRDQFGHQQPARPPNPILYLFLGGLLGVQLVVGLGLPAAIRAIGRDRNAG